MNSLLSWSSCSTASKDDFYAGNTNFVLQMKAIGKEKEPKELRRYYDSLSLSRKGVNDDMKYKWIPIQIS